MNKKESIQYTIRSIPSEVNEAVREYAVREGCSLNQAVIETLKKGSGTSDQKHHDLDFMAGSWVSDPSCEAALEEFNRIDEDLWK
ncbi:hypothetical protein [Pontiella sulfatireligans]|uniref:Arc-like DNA binding domain-containing protein n=1 Tax=Pontiella sulfatireligans TaxID=2750658 RepID=A0A6C2UL37_9BACT|nr:hypothetical protein [Pontiella sulfatireligans]VGO20121.1 hypothetical protein SCARR_02182 [Pontiella sulfatireligans]